MSDIYQAFAKTGIEKWWLTHLKGLKQLWASGRRRVEEERQFTVEPQLVVMHEQQLLALALVA